MKKSIKSSPKVTCHYSPHPHPRILSNKRLLAEAGGKSKLLASWSDKHIPSPVSRLLPPLKLHLFSKPRHRSLHWPASAFTLSQDCFSLKSLEDTSSQDLEDCAYLKRAGFLAGRGRRREGERNEWEILCVSTSSNNCVWAGTVPWCCQVMVHNSHSTFFPDSETVESFFTVVHSLGPPGSTMEKKTCSQDRYVCYENNFFHLSYDWEKLWDYGIGGGGLNPLFTICIRSKKRQCELIPLQRL